MYVCMYLCIYACAYVCVCMRAMHVCMTGSVDVSKISLSSEISASRSFPFRVCTEYECMNSYGTPCECILRNLAHVRTYVRPCFDVLEASADQLFSSRFAGNAPKVNVLVFNPCSGFDI